MKSVKKGLWTHPRYGIDVSAYSPSHASAYDRVVGAEVLECVFPVSAFPPKIVWVSV